MPIGIGNFVNHKGITSKKIKRVPSVKQTPAATTEIVPDVAPAAPPAAPPAVEDPSKVKAIGKSKKDDKAAK